MPMCVSYGMAPTCLDTQVDEVEGGRDVRPALPERQASPLRNQPLCNRVHNPTVGLNTTGASSWQKGVKVDIAPYAKVVIMSMES